MSIVRNNTVDFGGYDTALAFFAVKNLSRGGIATKYFLYFTLRVILLMSKMVTLFLLLKKE